MATFRTEGLDKIIQDMTAMGESSGELADEMLLAGAEEVKKAWKKSAQKKGHRDTGDMINSIGYSKTVSQISDIKSVDIYPQGKDRKGVKNALKAYVLDRGTSKIEASHFVDEAENMAGPMVEQRLVDIYDAWLKKHRMG